MHRSVFAISLCNIITLTVQNRRKSLPLRKVARLPAGSLRLHVGFFQVSWVRPTDSSILFIGSARFARDDRFELIPSRHGRWTLKIRFVKPGDAGKYECQVSTVPKISKTYTLKVVGKSVESIARIA